MATLLIDLDPDNERAFKADELDLRFEYLKPGEADESCRVHGERSELERLLWRYVTPIDAVTRGEWVTPTTASAVDREDFEHFSAWIED